MSICNLDCFKCSHDDCINNRLEYSDFTKDETDKKTHEQRLAKIRSDRYRAKHKTEVNARSLEWNRANAEHLKETQKKWRQENKERIAAAKRKRWAENPEYYRQKQREYRARKKGEVIGNKT